MSEAPETLSEVSRTGDQLAILRALRDLLSQEIDSCESKRDVAALSQRLMDVLAQIAAAEKAKPEAKGTALDELARRRKSAAGAARPARSS